LITLITFGEKYRIKLLVTQFPLSCNLVRLTTNTKYSSPVVYPTSYCCRL
jgi:hypothetical protein